MEQVPNTVGRLTQTGSAPGMIFAKCSCGYPVILPEAEWGNIFGCAVHNADAKRQHEADQASAERERAAEAREAAHRKDARSLNFAPHAEELSPKLRRMLERLSESTSFSAVSVGAMMRCEPSVAWEAYIYPLIEANCLHELTGVFGERRPYSEHESYSLRASKESAYSVRRMALIQLARLEALDAEAREDVPPPAPALPTYSAESEVADFISQRCHIGSDCAESPILLRARYAAWSAEQHRATVTPEEFAGALEKAGYPLRNAKRRGLRLRRAGELAAAAAA